MSEQLYRWVKASERLGDFQGSDIPDWKFWHPEFCKVDGRPAEGAFFRKDTTKNTIVFSWKYYPGSEFRQEINEKYFHRIEWLEPIPSAGDNHSLEEAARSQASKYISEEFPNQKEITIPEARAVYAIGFKDGAAYVIGGDGLIDEVRKANPFNYSNDENYHRWYGWEEACRNFLERLNKKEGK